MIQKIELYVISLAPLFVLLLISTIQVPRCWNDDCEFIGWKSVFAINIVPSVCLGVLLVTIVMFYRFNRQAKGATNLPKRIVEIDDIRFENLSFLATYIIPLVAFDLSKTRGCIMLVLVLILMGWIFVNTNTFYLNPSLAVLKYRIYRITTGLDEKLIVITRNELKMNTFTQGELAKI